MSRSRWAALRPEPRSTRLKQPERWTSTFSSFCGPASWNWVQPDGSSPSITETVPSLRTQRGTSFIIACWVRCVPDGRAGWAIAGSGTASAAAAAMSAILVISKPPVLRPSA